jgi:L-fuconolactonase
LRIDAHQHFWRYTAARDTWITAEMSVLRRDFLPGDLLPELKAAGFAGSIAVQADQSDAETSFLLDLADRNPAIRGVVGWVDLCAPDVSARLEKYSRAAKLSGFRHIAQAEADDFLLRADFSRGIDALKRFDFTYDILIYERQLPAAIALVERHPQQRFVVDHLAKPAMRAKHMAFWARGMRVLAANPNVYCKASGLVTEADWKSWRADEFAPYLDVVFETFGADRVMFGSDWPVCLLAATYVQVTQLIEDYVRALPAADQEKVFGGNAMRFYGLECGASGSATHR